MKTYMFLKAQQNSRLGLCQFPEVEFEPVSGTQDLSNISRMEKNIYQKQSELFGIDLVGPNRQKFLQFVKHKKQEQKDILKISKNDKGMSLIDAKQMLNQSKTNNN